MKQELLRNGFAEDRIEIHPPATNVDNAAAGSTFSSRNLIVYAGQLVRGKGVDVLLEALAQVLVPCSLEDLFARVVGEPQEQSASGKGAC